MKKNIKNISDKAQLKQYNKLLLKITNGNKNGESMDDFFNDIIDYYNNGTLDRQDFIKVMKEVSEASKQTKEYCNGRK